MLLKHCWIDCINVYLLLCSYVVDGEKDAINLNNKGTKAAAHYVLKVPAGGQAVVQMRICDDSSPHLEGAQLSFSCLFSQLLNLSLSLSLALSHSLSHSLSLSLSLSLLLIFTIRNYCVY